MTICLIFTWYLSHNLYLELKILITVHNIYSFKSHVITERKCPQDTSSNVARVWQLFKQGEFVKPLLIPTCVDDYNQFMGGVDITDQYHSYYTTQIVAQCNWLS